MTNQTKQRIQQALQQFQHGPLRKSSLHLLATLGYQSDRQIELDNAPHAFLEQFNQSDGLRPDKALVDDWLSAELLCQITDAEIRKADQLQLFDSGGITIEGAVIESYVFMAIALRDEEYTRTQLAQITREINKLFNMPVNLLFRHGQTLTIAIINRRLNKQDRSRDVLEKVTLIKDIRLANPHRAHVEILSDLSLDELFRMHGCNNFVELHRAWQKTLDSSELNKRFFKEIANWYFWAVNEVVFPAAAGPDATRNATSVIRLITRLIFVWFLKEKGLVPDDLFSRRRLEGLLTWDDPQDSTYYKAILQNLFFATLNQEMNTPARPDNRKFRGTRASGQDQHFMVHNVYRYEQYFSDPMAGLALFADIPFLNGGLFECLDRRVDSQTLRVDGFSDRPDNPLRVADELFFGDERSIDLNNTYGTSGKSYKVRGLIETLNRYKFTITENTPIEEEIALDPELLGKVFENLLAAYNPETGTTARKQTGSFYTPREIVNYMVDESLLAYLQTKVSENLTGLKDLSGLEATDQDLTGFKNLSTLEERLRHLFAYNEEPHQFSATEVAALIDAIDHVNILDPACGSGAFPMGILHKLVFILGKLDLDNAHWREVQRQKAIAETEEAFKLGDSRQREELLLQINDVFERNASDYGRKLFLIENCIYGVDIQPVAVQIAKLRFFISLVVDQRIMDDALNRGILPLPNLETKFVAANTLLGIDKPQQLALRNPAITAKEKELAEVRSKHFRARTPQTKEKWRLEDKRLRAEIGALLQKDGFPNETTTKLAHWDPYNQNASADFFDMEWMFGLEDGFDVVIGNPPYIKEYTARSVFDGLRDSDYYQGKMDIWYFFACISLDLLKAQTGVLTFIATNNWITNYGASILRNKFVNDATILQLIDFGNYKIFESADIQTMILIAKRNSLQPIYAFDLRKLVLPEPVLEHVVSLLAKIPDTGLAYLAPEFNRKQLKDKLLVFSDSPEEDLLNKMAKLADFFLDGAKEVANGIDVHQDFVNKKAQQLLGDNYRVGDGIFVLSQEKKDSIPFTAHELGVIKPYFTTAELQKYFGSNQNAHWVIYTDSSFKEPNKIKDYPNIKKHLDQYQAIITSDNKPYGLHRSRNEFFFGGEKIISVRKCAKPTFTYTDFDCYVSQTFYVIKTNRINLKYLTGVLNSKFVAFWLKHKGKMQGGQYQVDKAPLLNIPLKHPTPEQSSAIERKVERILAAKQADPMADVSMFEREIDKLVYALYNLTPAEIALIEGREQLPGGSEPPGSSAAEPLPAPAAKATTISTPPLIFTGQPPQGSFSAKRARLETLTKQATPAAIQELTAALTDDNITIRWQASTALRKIGGPQVASTLQAFIAHTNNPTAKAEAEKLLENL